MKQFLINTSSNDLKSSTEEILGLIDGKKEEIVQKSVRDFKEIDETIKSKGNGPTPKMIR